MCGCMYTNMSRSECQVFSRYVDCIHVFAVHVYCTILIDRKWPIMPALHLHVHTCILLCMASVGAWERLLVTYRLPHVEEAHAYMNVYIVCLLRLSG